MLAGAQFAKRGQGLAINFPYITRPPAPPLRFLSARFRRRLLFERLLVELLANDSRQPSTTVEQSRESPEATRTAANELAARLFCHAARARATPRAARYVIEQLD